MVVRELDLFDQDERMRVTLRDGSTRAEAIVFLHPALLRASVWSEVINLLPVALTCVAPDLRGHGLSRRSGPFTVHDWADDCWAVADQLQLGSVHLVAGSFGASIAVEMASMRTQQVASVTTFGGAFLPAHDLAEAFDASIEKHGVKEAFIREVRDGALSSDASQGVVKRALATISDMEPEVASELWRGALATDVHAALATYRAPTRVVVGDEDTSCPPAESEWFASQVGVEPVRLAGVGHLPMVEAPQITADLIARHVAAHSTQVKYSIGRN